MFVGNNPEFHDLNLDHEFSGEDEWLFDPNRKGRAEPWHFEQPSPNKPPRVIRRLGAKYADPARVLTACSINSRVCPQLKFWWEMDRYMAARTEWPEHVRGTIYPVTWAMMTDDQRKLLLEKQVEHARIVDRVLMLARFLYSLDESEWHHLGEHAT
jgi:hypothetical protein